MRAAETSPGLGNQPRKVHHDYAATAPPSHTPRQWQPPQPRRPVDLCTTPAAAPSTAAAAGAVTKTLVDDVSGHGVTDLEERCGIGLTMAVPVMYLLTCTAVAGLPSPGTIRLYGKPSAAPTTKALRHSALSRAIGLPYFDDDGNADGSDRSVPYSLGGRLHS